MTSEHRRTRVPGGIDRSAVSTMALVNATGCQFAVAADRIEGLVDGAAVSSWTDLSGNGRHFAQGTASLQPTYQTGEVNGLPVVRFDGSNDYLSTALSVSGIVAFSMVAVVRPLGIEGTKGHISWGATPTAPGPVLILQRNTTDVRIYAAGGYRFTVAHAQGATRLYVLTFQAGSPSGTYTLYVDGGAAATYSGDITGTASTFYLGVGYGNYTNVDLAEVAFYNQVLSAEERSAITTTLKSKYGIA